MALCLVLGVAYVIAGICTVLFVDLNDLADGKQSATSWIRYLVEAVSGQPWAPLLGILLWPVLLGVYYFELKRRP